MKPPQPGQAPDNPSAPRKIRVDPSRCLPMRFGKSACRDCLGVCPANALSLGEGLKIDGRACTECMLCLSVCPTGGMRGGPGDFLSLIDNLGKVPRPVLRCDRGPDLPAHQKTSCLGFLSEEHLIALAALLPRPLQLNLTACARCPNGAIVPVLRERVRSVAELFLPEGLSRILLVQDRSDLVYQEVSYDRRGFFKALRSLSLQGVRDLQGPAPSPEEEPAYSDKKLPPKRDLLNRSLPPLPEPVRRKVLEGYYYRLRLEEGCRACLACAAMCPTGALKGGKEEAAGRLLFNSSLCAGCGLCETFCRKNSLRLGKGAPQGSPFEFRPVELSPRERS